jgi:hypothetical protein
MAYPIDVKAMPLLHTQIHACLGHSKRRRKYSIKVCVQNSDPKLAVQVLTTNCCCQAAMLNIPIHCFQSKHCP